MKFLDLHETVSRIGLPQNCVMFAAKSSGHHKPRSGQPYRIPESALPELARIASGPLPGDPTPAEIKRSCEWIHERRREEALQDRLLPCKSQILRTLRRMGGLTSIAIVAECSGFSFASIHDSLRQLVASEVLAKTGPVYSIAGDDGEGIGQPSTESILARFRELATA